jgi:hypothetical protein
MVCKSGMRESRESPGLELGTRGESLEPRRWVRNNWLIYRSTGLDAKAIEEKVSGLVKEGQ